jgi:RHS repeat-associated protein
VYYVHTDHLNTPRRITSPSTNAIVWRWDSEPFGTAAANQNPSGTGTQFIYNLRFPGQYYDAETGLSYNYFRDYDPGTGRYIESDPIGLMGGVNTYAYVRGNTLMYVDPLGWVLVQVTLPGLGATFLDDSFYPLVQQFIDNASAHGVGLQFNSAYRTPARQAALHNDPNAITPANNSLHSCGFAVDVNYSVLPAAQQAIIRDAARAAGLSWGGNFQTPDPPHFYAEPSVSRDIAIQNATQEYQRLTGQH